MARNVTIHRPSTRDTTMTPPPVTVAPGPLPPPQTPPVAVVVVDPTRPPALPPETAPLNAEALNSTIAANMAGVDLIVRRPSGRIQVVDAAVEARNEGGEAEVIDAKKVTKPSFIVDRKEDSPLWQRLDDNGRALESIVRRYSVNDARRGFHLVPMSRAGNMIAELSAARRERLALAQVLATPAEYQKYKDALRRKFNGHFHLLEPKLWDPRTLMEKFDVTWTVHPLTPIDPRHLRFHDINQADQDAIIQESDNMVGSLVKARTQIIFNEVFGTITQKCSEIAAGAMETGARKFGSITELVDLLERLKNFREFATPEILQHADTALGLLSNITDINQVNVNKGQNVVTAAIKTATRPLNLAITKMLASHQPGSGRSRRAMES